MIKPILPLLQCIIALNRLQILYIVFYSLVQAFKSQSDLPYTLVLEFLLGSLLLGGLIHFKALLFLKGLGHTRFEG